MKQRILIPFLLLLVPIANAQVYTITDLGPLSPTAINIWGQVVGNLNGKAFIWTHFSGRKRLGTLTGGTSSYAASINDLGVVTGNADGLGTVISLSPFHPNQECNDLTQPFLWTPKGGMQGLGSVGQLEQYFYYWCEMPFYGTWINDLGQIVGYTDVFATYQYGLLWRSAAGMTMFGGSYNPTIVNGISNTGQIVGQNSGVILPVLFAHATSWKSGVATTLVDLSGYPNPEYISSANGVNDVGQIVGWSTTTTAQFCSAYPDDPCPMHAVLWTASGEISDLGTLPGDAFSAASNINFFGLVIGSSGNTLGFVEPGAPGGSGYSGQSPIAVIGHPFIWSERNGMQDLNTQISTGSGWVLNSATGINIWGQIVGSGTRNGHSHGFLLTPTAF
jgi:probable HAF family extracellular repeat protein